MAANNEEVTPGPAPVVEFLTKKQYLEVTAFVLKEVIQPHLLRNAMTAAAERLKIDPAIVEAVLAEAVATAPQGPGPLALALAGAVAPDTGKDGKKKKKGAAEGEEGQKSKRAGKISCYTLFVTWFLDFCAHYGLHPKVQAYKTQAPDLSKVRLAAHVYGQIPEEVKKELQDTYKEFLDAYNGEHMSQPGGNKGHEGRLLDELTKYEAKAAGRTFQKVLELRRKDEYKTDPQQAKADAAAAKEAAKEAAKAQAALAGAVAETPKQLAAAPAALPALVPPAAAQDSEDDDSGSSGDGGRAPSGSSDGSDGDSGSSSDSESEPPPPPTKEKKRKAEAEAAEKASKKKSKHDGEHKHVEVKREKHKEKKDKKDKKDKKEKKDKRRD